MSTSKIKLGFDGESKAVRFLKKNRYKIVERNFRCRAGEIDIVAKHKDFLVFVEVKTRSSLAFGMPREAVNFRKQQTIIKCAKLYILQHNLTSEAVRFDVVEILDGEVLLIQDAFRLQ